MKKFFTTIALCGAMLFCSNVFAQINRNEGTYKFQVGDSRIGVFCAPDESNLSMVMTTQQVYGGVAIDPSVEFKLHITSVGKDTIKGSIQWRVTTPGVIYGMGVGTYHYIGAGITSVGFLAIKCGNNYRIKYEGLLQFLDERQIYDFSAFNGLYRVDILNAYMDANYSTWDVVHFTKISAGTPSKTASSRSMDFTIELPQKKNVVSTN